MSTPAARLRQRIVRVAVVALLMTVSIDSIAAARAGQPAPVATLSLTVDVQGPEGLPPRLDPMAGANGLALTVTERACGGPGFSAFFFSDGQPIVTGGVTVTDTEIFRVDVEVPAMTDGTDCEYTIEPSGLLCYRTDDVIADGPAGEQLLSEAGYPTGEVVSPASGDVVAVTATYTDLCSEVRAEVDGLGDREVLVQMQSEPVDPADRSVDCGDVGPSPIPVPFSSGTWLVAGTATAGCTATVALFAYSPSGPLVPDEGCTITPASDQFIIEYPVTTRQFTAVCAAAAPVPAEPTFTG